MVLTGKFPVTHETLSYFTTLPEAFSCHKRFKGLGFFPSFFALQQGGVTMLSNWWQSSDLPVITLFQASSEAALTLVSCFKTISLFDLLLEFVILRLNYFLSGGDYGSFLPQAPVTLFSHGSPLVAKFLHTDAPCCLRSWLHFLVCFWLHPFYPALLPLPGEIGTPEQIKPGRAWSFTQTYNGLGYTSKERSLWLKPVPGSSHLKYLLRTFFMPSTKKFFWHPVIVTSPKQFSWKRHYVTWFSQPSLPPGSYGAILGDGGLLNGASLGHRRTA